MTKLMGEHMSRREIDAIVKEADDNGDGTVDFEGVNCLLAAVQTNIDNKTNVSNSIQFSLFLEPIFTNYKFVSECFTI